LSCWRRQDYYRVKDDNSLQSETFESDEVPVNKQ
jgi:hypothetical protein